MINEDETRQLAGEHNLFCTAKLVFKMGPKTMIIKRARMAPSWCTKTSYFPFPHILFRKHSIQPAPVTRSPGGFMGYIVGKGRINEQTLRSAMVYGSVLASLMVERFGVDDRQG